MTEEEIKQNKSLSKCSVDNNEDDDDDDIDYIPSRNCFISLKYEFKIYFSERRTRS